MVLYIIFKPRSWLKSNTFDLIWLRHSGCISTNCYRFNIYYFGGLRTECKASPFGYYIIWYIMPTQQVVNLTTSQAYCANLAQESVMLEFQRAILNSLKPVSFKLLKFKLQYKILDGFNISFLNISDMQQLHQIKKQSSGILQSCSKTCLQNEKSCFISNL